MVDWGGNYPPGARNDPNAPYNQPEPPICPECDQHIREEDDHDEDCPALGKNAQDLIEDKEAAAADAAYERKRDKEMSDR